MNSTDQNSDGTFGFWPLLIPLAASIATPLITKAVSKNKKDSPPVAPQILSGVSQSASMMPIDGTGMSGGMTGGMMESLMPMAQQMMPNLMPAAAPTPSFVPPQPILRPEPVEPTYAPITRSPINVHAVPFFPKEQAEPSPAPSPAPVVFKNLGVTPILPPVTMMTTNYAVRGTDNKMRTLKVPSRPLESGESIKVRITFYAATNKAGLVGCGLDTNSTNYLGAFGNKLVPFKSVAASIGNFAGRNSKYTVSPENHPVFKKFQKIKIPEVAQIITSKLGIPHDGIFQIDDTGQDVVAQVSENGANPVIDVFVPDCMDIQNLGSSIRYATVTVI